MLMTDGAFLQKFCQEWEALEKKAAVGLAGLATVSEFLRRWTKAAAELPSPQGALLITTINTASASLLAQVESIEQLLREGREKARLEAELKARSEAQRVRDESRQREHQDREEQERARTAREKLRQTQEEIRRINAETAKIVSDGAAHRNHMNRVLTNPELYCPRCHQAYADTARGCVHCSCPHSPYS